MYAQDSIDMLTSAGIQFKRHEEEGIEVDDFAELLMTSGLVLREEITWITFARYITCHGVEVGFVCCRGSMVVSAVLSSPHLLPCYMCYISITFAKFGFVCCIIHTALTTMLYVF